jgi:hypothetical protein
MGIASGAARDPAALSEVPPGLQPIEEQLRVVIIEDNRDAADTLRILLGLLGHEVSRRLFRARRS